MANMWKVMRLIWQVTGSVAKNSASVPSASTWNRMTIKQSPAVRRVRLPGLAKQGRQGACYRDKHCLFCLFVKPCGLRAVWLAFFNLLVAIGGNERYPEPGQSSLSMAGITISPRCSSSSPLSCMLFKAFDTPLRVSFTMVARSSILIFSDLGPCGRFR